jgi:hypothetical protein
MDNAVLQELAHYQQRAERLEHEVEYLQHENQALHAVAIQSARHYTALLAQISAAEQSGDWTPLLFATGVERARLEGA